MDKSSDKNQAAPPLSTERRAVGQLLVRLLAHFRAEIFDAQMQSDLFPDIRFAHLTIWGNLVRTDGLRLTDLARRANLSQAACSELVADLEANGYLERRPDPTDGRARLIYPTKRGEAFLSYSAQNIANLEQRWREHLAPDEFNNACATFDALLRRLDNDT